MASNLRKISMKRFGRAAKENSLVCSHRIRKTSQASVDATAAQVFSIDLFPDGHPDQWRPTQEHLGLLLDKDGVVR